MEEEKSVKYDARKLTLEVFRHWQALIVIALVVAVIFCVVCITEQTDMGFEAKEGFSISYPPLSLPEGVEEANAQEILNFMLAEQQRAVARAVDTLANTAYIELYNAIEKAGLENKYRMETLKESVSVALSNSNTTLTVTVVASSAADAVFMLDNVETQVKAAIGSGETQGYSVTLNYKNGKDDLNKMYALEDEGALGVIVIVVEGLVIGFVAAVIILLIYNAAFLRVTYPEDISVQTDYPVLATVFEDEAGAIGEACIKSAMVRGKEKKTTYVLGVSRKASDVASAWAAKERNSQKTLYIDFDDAVSAGLDRLIADGDAKIESDTLAAGGADVYGERESIAAAIEKAKKHYDRVIISGFTADDARSELIAVLADDTALVVDEGYPVKKLIALEEKYKGEMRNIEGVVLRRRGVRKSK